MLSGVNHLKRKPGGAACKPAVAKPGGSGTSAANLMQFEILIVLDIVMADLHCRMRTRIPTRTRIPCTIQIL